jgi:hypothetical protein
MTESEKLVRAMKALKGIATNSTECIACRMGVSVAREAIKDIEFPDSADPFGELDLIGDDLYPG